MIEKAARLLSSKKLYENEGVSLINEKLNDVSHIGSIIDEILPGDDNMVVSTLFKAYGGASSDVLDNSGKSEGQKPNS